MDSVINRRKKVLANLILHAKTQAKLASNPDFKIKHPDWCRDAQTGNYKQLEIEITKRFTRKMFQRDAIRANIEDEVQ